MTVLEALPILGTIQSLVALAYLLARRRTTFANGLGEVGLFTALALAVYDGTGGGGTLEAVAMVAWGFVPPLAVVFARSAMGIGRGRVGPLLAGLVAPALILSFLTHALVTLCVPALPCVGVASLESLWGSAAALVGLGLIAKDLMAHAQTVAQRPKGGSRNLLALGFAVILLLRALAEAGQVTAPGLAEGVHAAATVGWVLILNIITLQVTRLYPEETEQVVAEVAENDHVNRFRRYLAQAVVFEEGGVGPLVRGTVLTTILTVLALIAWSTITPVKETAVTFGAVIPSSNIRPIQHLEGGIVSSVLVREGQLVEKGEVLMKLDPAQAVAELEQTRAREAGLVYKAERLRAFAEGRAIDLQPGASEDHSLAADQSTIFNAQNRAKDTALQVLQAQISQREADIALFENQMNAMDPQIALVAREMAMRAELAAKGLTSQVVYLNVQREHERLKAERVRLKGQLATAREALSEARTRMSDLRTKLSQDAFNEMGSVTAELAQVREARAKLEDRVTRLDVVAPVRGLVQELAVTSPGAVIQQGGLVTKIVPVDDTLMIENQITPRDVGHVQPGQPVRVKVTSYDFARFGAVQGKLVQVSPSTFLDEKKNPYYKGMVELDKVYVGEDPQHNRILPGMTVQVDVITGEKTILQYLLKPIYIAASQAFRER